MWLLALWACSSSYTLEGTVENGLSGEPLGGFGVVAAADDPAITLSCRTFQGAVDEQGNLSVAGLCAGTSYTLTLSGQVVSPDLASVPAGGPGGPLSAKAYPAPEGEGIYTLVDGALTSVKSNADQKKEVPLGGSEPVYFPGTTPGKFPVVPAGGFLVLSGEATDLQLVPLVVNPNRLELEGSQPMTPWFYVGSSFEGNVATPVAADVDASKVTEVSAGERTLRYLAADAVPSGRYVLYQPGQRRMTMFDMGGEATLELPDASGDDDGDGKKKKGKGKGRKK